MLSPLAGDQPPPAPAPSPPRSASASPAFLGIGAPRSGTTWLYRNLGRHPQIWLPPLKELHYFDQRRVARVANRYFRAHLRKRLRRQLAQIRRGRAPNDLSWDLRYFLGRRNKGWYVSLFRPRAGQIAGEITPAYSMLDRETVEEIHEINPDLKVIYLLRDPIERAWSGALSEFVRRRRRPLESITDDEFILHFDRPGHLLRGDYVRTLSIWEGVFGPGQVFVGFLEQIQHQPRQLLLDLCRFLGIEVDDAVLTDGVGRRINFAGDYRGRVPERFERRLARQHLPQLRLLAARFGSPADAWLERAERALGSSRELIRPGAHSP